MGKNEPLDIYKTMISRIDPQPQRVATHDVEAFVHDGLPKLPDVSRKLLIDILKLQHDVTAGVHDIHHLDGKAPTGRITTEPFPFDERLQWSRTGADNSVKLRTQDINYLLKFFIVGERTEALDIGNGNFDLRRSVINFGIIDNSSRISVKVPDAHKNIPNVGWPLNSTHRSTNTDQRPSLLMAKGLELEDPEGDNLAQLLYRFRERMLQAGKKDRRLANN